MIRQAELHSFIRMTGKTDLRILGRINDIILPPRSIRMNTAWTVTNFTTFSTCCVIFDLDTRMCGKPVFLSFFIMTLDTSVHAHILSFFQHLMDLCFRCVGLSYSTRPEQSKYHCQRHGQYFTYTGHMMFFRFHRLSTRRDVCYLLSLLTFYQNFQWFPPFYRYLRLAFQFPLP